MRWPQCKEFRPGTFKKEKCAECFHTAGEHGASAAASAGGSDKPAEEPVRRRAPATKKKSPSPERKKVEEAPKKTPAKKKSPSPERKKRSPSPVRRRRSPSPTKAAPASSGAEEVKDTMRCVVAKDGAISVETRSTPKPGKEEVLVRVKASGLNQADLLQAKGKYPPPSGASDVLGLEVSGIVAKVGFGAKDFWAPGDRVCGLVAGGGYGEYCVVHTDSLIELPNRMSFEEGAGVPEAFLTAYQALFFLADLKNRVRERKQNILIWGASGGVGSAAVQLARYFEGNNTRVVAMASTSEKCSYVKDIGAHVAINYKDTDNLVRAVERECEGGIDILIDLVGAANFATNLKVMATDGVMIMLGFLSGSQCSETELRDILAKRITIKGSTLRSRDDVYKGVLTQSFVEDFGSQLDRGTLKVEIDRKFDLEHCPDAHNYMSESKHKGKIILTIPASWNGSSEAVVEKKVEVDRSADAEETERRERRERREKEEQEEREREKKEREQKERREQEERERRDRERKEREQQERREQEEKERKEKERKEKERKEKEEREKERKERERKEKEDADRREKEKREKEERERKERAAERNKSLESSKSSLSTSSGGGGGGGGGGAASGAFKPCKSNLVDDDKSPISEKEGELILAQVNNVIKNTKQFPRGFANIDALIKSFRDGILPCVHLGALCPKDIDVRAVTMPVDDDRDRQENFTLYLNSARGVGATFDRSISRTSLVEAPREAVLACLWQNIKCGHNIRFQREPSIRSMVASASGASEAEIRDEWPANKIMFTWVNAVAKTRAKSFPELWESFLPLLNHCFKSGAASAPDALSAAKEAIKIASKNGITDCADADALATGHGRITFALIGEIFAASLKK